MRFLPALLKGSWKSLHRYDESCLVNWVVTHTFQTQLQILTAVVKLFLKKPDNNQGLVQQVLQAATADNDNPDIRDRAYVYWRLLSGDLQVAKVSKAYVKISHSSNNLEHHSLRQTSHYHYYDFPSTSAPE